MAKVLLNSTGALVYHYQDDQGLYQVPEFIELKIVDPDGITIAEHIEPTYLGFGVYQFILPITYTTKEGRYSAYWHTKKFHADITDIEYFDVVKVEDEYVCTVKDVKEFMGITNNLQDELIRQLIFAFQGMIEGYCKFTFKPTGVINERHSGDNTRKLILNNYPILDISKVEIVNQGMIPERDITNNVYEGFICEFSSGIISLTDSYIFPRGTENILVSYVYGYDEPLYDLKMAALEWISFKFRYKDSLGIESESLGPYRITYDKSYLPDNVKIILDRYVQKMGV